MLLKKKITKQVVVSLKPGETIWDTQILGFGVRRQRSEVRNFVLKTRINGIQKQFTIGKFGQPLTVEDARTKANKILGQAVEGVDPRRQNNEDETDITIAELCTLYLRDYAAEHKRPSSVKTDTSNINNHVIPLLGRRYVNEIKKKDILAFKQAVRGGQTALSRKEGNKGGGVVKGGAGMANRCISLLSKIFNCAIDWEIRLDGINPAQRIKKYSENPVERYLKPKEADCLLRAINDEKEVAPYAALALELLLMTGARRGEILGLKWSYIDYEKGIAFLPDSKSGEKSLYLNDWVIQLLKDTPKEYGNPYVICGKSDGKPLNGLWKVWQRVKLRTINHYWHIKFPDVVKSTSVFSEEELTHKLRKVGIETEQVNFLLNFRIHDLRHHFASVFVTAGFELHTLMKLLGHKNFTTTLRYAHIAPSTLHNANNEAANIIRGGNRSSGPAPVSPFMRRINQ